MSCIKKMMISVDIGVKCIIMRAIHIMGEGSCVLGRGGQKPNDEN